MAADEEKPCWVWWEGAWREGFVLRWMQRWDDSWWAYAEWTTEREDGPHFRRGSVPAAMVTARVSLDPRGRGGEKPPPLLSD